MFGKKFGKPYSDRRGLRLESSKRKINPAFNLTILIFLSTFYINKTNMCEKCEDEGDVAGGGATMKKGNEAGDTKMKR